MNIFTLLTRVKIFLHSTYTFEIYRTLETARLKMPYKLFVTKETGGRPYLSFEDISYASKNLQ